MVNKPIKLTLVASRGPVELQSFRREMVDLVPDVSTVVRDVLFDPQTSGGLLIGCAEKYAFELKNRLIAKGVNNTAIIGKVYDNEKAMINVL